MKNLIAQLREKYDVDSIIAARLGLSRQAFSQAAQRGRLSESAAIAAADLLNIELGAALLANAKNLPSPVRDTGPDLPHQPPESAPNNTNYALSRSLKKRPMPLSGAREPSFHTNWHQNAYPSIPYLLTYTSQWDHFILSRILRAIR